MKTAALFLNGDPPNKSAMNFALNYKPEFHLCTDGAYYYMNRIAINPDAIIGDMDSLHDIPKNTQVYFIEDQNTTDFEKGLDFLVKQGFERVVVLGSTGGQNDHFLGNLNAAFKFRNSLDIIFFDQTQRFFLVEREVEISTSLGKIVSLFPFPTAFVNSLEGLQYSLSNEELNLLDRVGTRNVAVSETVKIYIEKGSLWVFVAY